MGDDFLETGTHFGGYRIERLLGRGGMGAVYLAYDTTLRRRVALKLLTDPEGSENSRARLLREARNAAALNHPNICTVYEVNEANGLAFMAMEHVEGASLRDRIDAGALTVGEAVGYALQAADALTCAHARGVVHRDFKAANTIVTAGGRLKIVDFGLAQRRDPALADATTMTTIAPAGTVAGTPYAMAPEQVRGEAADARTDIWALGVLLYEMVSGKRPFEAPTTSELFSSILRDAPGRLPPGVPADLRGIIEGCLEKAPERRYEDAREVRAKLEVIRSGTSAPWPGRRRWAVAGASLLAAAVALLALDVGGLRDRSGSTFRVSWNDGRRKPRRAPRRPGGYHTSGCHRGGPWTSGSGTPSTTKAFPPRSRSSSAPSRRR